MDNAFEIIPVKLKSKNKKLINTKIDHAIKRNDFNSVKSQMKTLDFNGDYINLLDKKEIGKKGIFKLSKMDLALLFHTYR